MGQFEHTLIIAEEGSEVHYIEGCSTPGYGTHNLHSGGVEVFVGEDAHVQYSTVQNWSKNTFNLNTKRAIVEENGTMEWVSGSMGSKVTMLYPCTILRGSRLDRHPHHPSPWRARVRTSTPARRSATTRPRRVRPSNQVDRQDGGRTNYRGLVHIADGAENSSTAVECDALMFDNESTSDTMPYMEIEESKVDVAHEATVGKIGDEDILPPVARTGRRRRQEDDRRRLHRADHGGTADRVRGRTQPPHRTRDGGSPDNMSAGTQVHANLTDEQVREISGDLEEPGRARDPSRGPRRPRGLRQFDVIRTPGQDWTNLHELDLESLVDPLNAAEK